MYATRHVKKALGRKPFMDQFFILSAKMHLWCTRWNPPIFQKVLDFPLNSITNMDSH